MYGGGSGGGGFIVTGHLLELYTVDEVGPFVESESVVEYDPSRQSVDIIELGAELRSRDFEGISDLEYSMQLS